MPELTCWHELPLGGAVAPADARQPITGDWRTAGRPVARYAACVNCLLCWLYCPDSAIVLKGCALCVEVCPTGALVMEPEA